MRNHKVHASTSQNTFIMVCLSCKFKHHISSQTVENKEHKEAPNQQPYYGWQYDQDNPGPQPEQPPPALQPNTYPPQPPPYSPQMKRASQPPKYQQPIPDMGSTLGYAQGMDYHYYDSPQPSQSIPQLRQARLQQLREDRMRRQQRRMGQDITTVIQRKKVTPPQDAPTLRRGMPQHMPPSQSWGPNAPPSLQPAPPSLPVPPNEETALQSPSPLPQGNGVPPSAAVSAQDTGVLKRARIGQATMILTGSFVASRFLGLLRTSLFAYVFGTTHISDAYVQAFLVPDTIFNIVAGGALGSAFIPIFVKYMVGNKDEKSAWHIASSALNLAIAIMMGLALIVIIFARQIVPLYSPGVPPFELDLIASLIRIMLLQAIVLGAGVIVTSVLQARQNFLIPAIGTVLYNVGLIVGLLPGVYLALHNQRNDTFAVYAATWGVVLGALLQVGFQIPGLVKVRMHYAITFDWRHPAVIQIGRLMLPRIFNAAMLSLTIFVDRFLISSLVFLVGSTLVAGLITQYYQAFQILLLPLGIFGMAISTAAFPTMTEYVARGRMDRVRSIIMETLRGILFMSIPSSVGLIVLNLPIIQVLLEHGRYSLHDANSTAVPLAFFAIGLAGHASVEILTRSFYALQDTVTPVIISIAQFILKIALSLILIYAAYLGPQWGMGGLALATSIAALVEASVLLYLLHQRLGGLPLRELANFLGRILLGAIAMGLIVLLIRYLLDTLLVTTDPNHSLGFGGTILATIKLLIEMSVGVFIYIRAARILHIEELNLGPIRRLLDRLKLSWL
jgi:putative peptidoglycan lipid II flippase